MILCRGRGSVIEGAGGRRSRGGVGGANAGESLGPGGEAAGRIPAGAMTRGSVRVGWRRKRSCGPMGVGGVDGHETAARARERTLREQSRRGRRGWGLGSYRRRINEPR